MSLHLGTLRHGTDELLYVMDQCSWAFDECCPGVNNILAESRTSNNLSFNGDGERQRKKARIKVTLSLLRVSPS